MVVHQDHLHWCLLFHDGTKLLNTHLETAIAHKAADCTVRCSKGGTDGCWHTIAHRAKPTAGADTAFFEIFEITGCKQLILTNIRHKHGIAFGGFCYCIHHLSHQQGTLFGMDGRLYHFLIFLLLKRDE